MSQLSLHVSLGRLYWCGDRVIGYNRWRVCRALRRCLPKVAWRIQVVFVSQGGFVSLMLGPLDAA